VIGLSGSQPDTAAQAINGSDTGLRGMRDSDARKDGTIKKAAFLPRKNGRDRDGLSISIADQALLDVHRAKFELPGKATASISISSIEALGLTVHPDADPPDLRHALIKGILDITVDANLPEVERIAELLAKRATKYNFPHF
jgi:hypothetical protein